MKQKEIEATLRIFPKSQIIKRKSCLKMREPPQRRPRACMSIKGNQKHLGRIQSPRRSRMFPYSVKLVFQRIQAKGPLLYHLTHREDIPKRTDVGQVPYYRYRTQKHTLFGLQEDLCKGCCIAFPFRNFTVDNIVLRSRGGTDHPDNLQLLCAACNGLKGNRTQTELIAALWRNGIIDSKKETAIITNPKIARGEDQNQQAGYSSLQAPTFRQQHQKSVVCRQ